MVGWVWGSGTDRSPKLGVIPGLTRDPSRDDATAARWVVLGDLAAGGGISRWAPACAGVTSGVGEVWEQVLGVQSVQSPRVKPEGDDRWVWERSEQELYARQVQHKSSRY